MHGLTTKITKIEYFCVCYSVYKNGKRNAKLFLCMPWTYRGREVAVPLLQPKHEMLVRGQFSLQPVYPEGENFQYPSGRRLGGPRNWDGPFIEGKNKNLLLLLGIEPWFLSYPNDSLIIILTLLSCLTLCMGFLNMMLLRLQKKYFIGVWMLNEWLGTQLFFWRGS